MGEMRVFSMAIMSQERRKERENSRIGAPSDIFFCTQRRSILTFLLAHTKTMIEKLICIFAQFSLTIVVVESKRWHSSVRVCVQNTIKKWSARSALRFLLWCLHSMKIIQFNWLWFVGVRMSNGLWPQINSSSSICVRQLRESLIVWRDSELKQMDV